MPLKGKDRKRIATSGIMHASYTLIGYQSGRLVVVSHLKEGRLSCCYLSPIFMSS